MPGESQETPVTGRPDPSVLTTEQLLREITGLKEWVTTLVGGQVGVLDEKFVSVETQFALIERQRVEQKQDTKQAVDAALAAAKEAVQEQTKASGEAIGKSEALTATTQAQQQTQYETGIKGVIDKHDDLKDRVIRLEQRKDTMTETRNTQRLDSSQVVAFIAVLVAVVATILPFLR